MSYDSENPFVSLTHATSSFLACGPLKVPCVMSELLGREVTPEKEPVYLSGFELVIVGSADETLPQFALNPVDYGEVTLARYHDLSPQELELINKFNRVGDITEARIDTAGFGHITRHFLIHIIREGASFARYDFGLGADARRDAIYAEEELLAINPMLDEYRAMARQFRDGPLLTPQSRR